MSRLTEFFTNRSTQLAGDSLLWRLLSESIRRQRILYIISVIAMVIVASSTAGTAWIMGEIIDSMSDAENRRRVWRLLR